MKIFPADVCPVSCDVVVKVSTDMSEFYEIPRINFYGNDLVGN